MECSPVFLVIDLFCGAGGTTTGFVRAVKDGCPLAKVIACINHDPLAIKSHSLNHSQVRHFQEDIRTLDISELTKTLEYWKKRYPATLIVLWASLECTNFSNAKGGKARNADSRTLAQSLYMRWDGEKYVEGESYIQILKPDYIMIENVVEFMAWGPLNELGKPISKRNGSDWMHWCEEIKHRFNYIDGWREMNSANYGAYTSRNRLFGIFAKPWLPVTFPEPTYAKTPARNALFGDLKQWKEVGEVLDFSDEGRSILNRKISLSDNSLDRIYAGLLKFVASQTVNGPKKSSGISGRKAPTGQPKAFISHYYGNGFNTEITEPLPTITTKERAALIQLKYLSNSDHSHFVDQKSDFGSTNDEAVPHCVIAVTKEEGQFGIGPKQRIISTAICNSDSESVVRIKKFMAASGIIDIKMRMLRVPELMKIQGFGSNYILAGSAMHKIKFIGNSVVPGVVKAWAEALAEGKPTHLQQAA